MSPTSDQIVITSSPILTISSGVIAHVVNCMDKFGLGFAGQIAHTFPWAKRGYHAYTPKELGRCLITQSDDMYIAHLFGQYYYGSRRLPRVGEHHLEYDALEKAFDELCVLICQSLPKTVRDIHIPDMIGCGLAGGNRETVLEILTRILLDYPQLTLYIHKSV